MGCGASADGGYDGTTDGPERFKMGRALGDGFSCQVYQATDKKTKQKVAAKFLNKDSDALDTEELFKKEAQVLQLVKHKNCMEYVSAYETDESWVLVSRLYSGGELFEYISVMETFSEHDASRLVRCMLEALDFLHRNNIVHRDLKPENFVLQSKKTPFHLRLIDFGCADVVPDAEIVENICGTPNYIAPEVAKIAISRGGEELTSKVWKKSDVWSVGIIMWILVFGGPPYFGDGPEDIMKNILREPRRAPKGNKVSSQCLELLNGMLNKDPEKRLSAAQCLKHPWVGGDGVSKSPLPDYVAKAIGKFHAASRLKKAIRMGLANKLGATEKEHLDAIFKQYDTNGDGRLSSDELAVMMKELGGGGNQLLQAMGVMDENGDGMVDLDEFVGANIEAELDTEDKVKAAFKDLDNDGDGYLSTEEITKFCKLSKDEVENMISESDKDGDGKIGWEEWLTAMGKAAPKPDSAQNK